MTADSCCYCTQLVYTAYSVIALNGIVNGTGKHAVDLTPGGASVALRAWWLCEVLYSPLVLLIRTSIALILLRIATNPVHRWVVYVDMGLVWVLTVAYFFVVVFQCTPVSYFWTQVLGEEQARGGRCADGRVVPVGTIALSAVSAVSDWILGLLPIAVLWNVQLSRRTKAAISLLLGVGLL